MKRGHWECPAVCLDPDLASGNRAMTLDLVSFHHIVPFSISARAVQSTVDHSSLLPLKEKQANSNSATTTYLTLPLTTEAQGQPSESVIIVPLKYSPMKGKLSPLVYNPYRVSS